jgi:ABC-type transport system substrate-binding protein
MERNIAAALASINPKFNVNTVGVDWPNYMDYYNKDYLPVFAFGWLADFADPRDLARIYMHSNGTIASLQRYNDTYVDYLVDLGLSQPDGPERNATYQELQYIYWRDIPSLPLYQPTGRPLYSGLYYYDIYKEAVSTPSDGGGQVVDYSVQIIAFGTVVVTIIVGSAVHVRHRKKESTTAKEETDQGPIQNL